MMKKSFTASFLCFALIALLFSPAPGQTVDEILKKMIEAQGGSESFKSVKDMTVIGSIDLVQQGMSGALTVYKKEPDKRRVDVEIMGMMITQAYDGIKAWWTNPQTGSTEELSGQQAADLKRQAMPIVASLDPAKYGLSYVFKGKETVEGKEYFVLEETYPDGLKATLYVDSETYLVPKEKAKIMGQGGVEVEVEQVMSDFRKEAEMMMAHTIITYQNGAEYSKISFKDANFNTGLEDSLFVMSK
jgi:outer membrane lipoprotein-sorting protein